MPELSSVDPPASPRSPLQTLGERIGRYWLIYGAGAFALAVLSLTQVVVVTHFLSPTQLGRLAALQAFAALITVLLLMGALQGTMARVFGAQGDEDAVDLADGGAVPASDAPTRSIATGLTIMLCGAVVIVGVVWPLAPRLAGLLIGDEGEAGLVRAITIAGIAGAPFRLFLVYPRYARRAGRYVALELGRSLGGLAVSVALLAAGLGIEAVVIGTVVGELGGVAVSLVTNRREIELSFSASEARTIVRSGAGYAPILFSNYIVLHSDILILTAYTSPAQVGRYRLAVGVARMVIYPVTIFLIAWGPLTRSPLQIAAERERSPAEVGMLLLRYVLVAGVGILLVAALFGNVLVKVSPASYAGAASLIPLIGAAYVVRALFVIVYRTALFPRKRRVFIALFVLAAVIFLAMGLAATPALGGAGTAAARTAGFSAALVGMIAFSQRSASSLPVPWWHISITFVAGLLAWGIGDLASEWAAPAAIAGPLTYVAIVLTTGVVPRAHWRPLGRMLAALRPSRPARRMERRLVALPPEDIALLRRALREHAPAAEIARERGEEHPATLARLARVLNDLSGLEGEQRLDLPAVRYALTYQRLALHDRVGRQLVAEGVPPMSLDSLEEALRLLGRIPLRRWRPRDPGRDDPVETER